MKTTVECVRAAWLLVALWPQAAFAGRKPAEPPPVLSVEHHHPSGAFAFRTPDGWTVQASTAHPEVMEAWAGDLGVRFVYRAGEAGSDALHADCMLERLAGPMDIEPSVQYEYEYVGGAVGSRRALDSAFVVHYDEPRHGHKEWRQRSVTVVGGGDSLCVVSYVPRQLWKSSPPSRAVVDSVLSSVTFSRP
jgi:hypothetical protein